MRDRAINSALLALQKQVIRAKANGVAHVEALLALRGVDMPIVRAARLPDVAGKGIMALLVLGASRGGPQRMADIAAHVHAGHPKRGDKAASTRKARALAKVKDKALMRSDGRFWSVT